MLDRVNLLQHNLDNSNLDALLISSVPNIIYLTKFQGFDLHDRNAYLLITKKEAFMFTHGIYLNAVKKMVRNFTILPITREQPLNENIKGIITTNRITKLGFEASDLRVSEYTMLSSLLEKNILKPTNLLEKIRRHKEPNEIVSIKKACTLTDQAFSYFLSIIHEGKTEKELACDLDYFINTHGATRLSFDTIIAFGANAANPHHVPTTKKLKTNTLLLLDFGCVKNSYCSDMTRTIAFGHVNTRQKKAYETVLESQQKAIDYISQKLSKNQKIQASEVDTVSREYILKRGYPTMPHSLGHGIGIQVHEGPRLTPTSAEVLEQGDVFSIEPGIYLPGQFGIRIEDLFTINNGSLLQLTQAKRDLIKL